MADAGNTIVAAGKPAGNAGTGASAITLNDAQLVHDPGVFLVPSKGQPSIARSGTSSVELRRFAALAAGSAPPGGWLTVDLFAPSGHAALVFVSRSAHPKPSVFGDVWLQLHATLLVFAGVMPATERIPLALQLPAGVRAGTPLLFQAVLGRQAIEQLSTPATSVVE